MIRAVSLLFLTCLLPVLVDFFPGHAQAVVQAIVADREKRRAAGEDIAANAPRTLDEQLMSIEARLRPAHRMLRRLQQAGSQAIAALWPEMPVLRTPSRTANWLEVAAGRLEAWKGSSARAGARCALEFVKAGYPDLSLDQLATLRAEAQPELAAMEDDFVKRAAAIAEYVDTSVFVPERADNGEEAPPEWLGMNPNYGEDSADVIGSSAEEGDEVEAGDEMEAPEAGAGDQPQLDRASNNEPRPTAPTAAGGDQAESAPASDTAISAEPPNP